MFFRERQINLPGYIANSKSFIIRHEQTSHQSQQESPSREQDLGYFPNVGLTLQCCHPKVHFGIMIKR